jgi:hypothetical protein
LASREIGVFTPAQLRRSWASTLHYERTSGVQADRSAEYAPPDAILFRNDSGHEIPAYGVMQMTDTVEEGYGNYLKVVRPYTYTAVMTPFLFNSDRAVPDGEFGTAQCGPIFRAIKDASTLTPGVRMSPSASAFTMTKGSVYVYLGEDDVVEDCIRVMSCETSMLAVATSGIPANGSATVTSKIPTAGDWTTGGTTYTARNPSSTAIPSSALVICFPVDAKWVAVEIC